MHVLLTHSSFSTVGHGYAKSAAVGAVAWAVALPLLRPDWATAVLLFAPLVLLPLAMRLLARLPLPPGEGWGEGKHQRRRDTSATWHSGRFHRATEGLWHAATI